MSQNMCWEVSNGILPVSIMVESKSFKPPPYVSKHVQESEQQHLPVSIMVIKSFASPPYVSKHVLGSEQRHFTCKYYGGE